MLRYIRARDLTLFPALAEGMFRDRAAQFRDRLGWDVAVDAEGRERDAYDALDPLYVIWQRPDGTHGGSMRFLPTLGGPTMVNDHFARLAPGGRVAEAGIWECTRFCLAADAPARTSAALMLGGAEVGAGLGLREAVGVFDDRMVRIYGRLGWPPRIVGREGAGPAAVALGFWAFSELTRRNLARRAGLSADLSRLWFARALGPLPLAA